MTQSDQGTACSATLAGGFDARFAELAQLLAPVFHLLSGAVWDEDSVRDRVRGFVARHLGEGGVLIFDETGDLKKGTCTAGAGRQYTGTTERIENAVVAEYATYATAAGHSLVDRGLYVQEQWFADPGRMAKAGFEPDHAFATKPQLAKAQAERALDAGLAPAWATGDEVYGRSSELREVFEARGIGYVFAVGCEHTLTTSGRVRMRADQALHLSNRTDGTAARAGTALRHSGDLSEDWLLRPCSKWIRPRAVRARAMSPSC